MTIDLVGPKGYVHGWRYVGGPGLPSVADHAAAMGRAAGLNRRIAASQPGDWRNALKQYDQDVASGKVQFAHGSKFATSYPGHDASEASLGRFMAGHTAPGDVSFRTAGGSRLPTGKASETTAGRKALLKAGHALPPSKPGGRPGYPIGDAAHWDKAFRAVGRSGGGARRAALAKLLRSTAAEFGRTGKIKGSWLDTSRGAMNMANVLNLARMTCPNCGYAADDEAFSGTNDASDTSRMPSALQTPAPGGLDRSAGFNAGQIGVRGASSGSYGTSNTGGRAIELSRRLPVATAMDILVSRGEGGRAVVRHRRGGGPIGQIYRNEAGQWVSELDGGKTLQPHTQQRAAVVDLITTYNGGVGNAYHRPAEPQSLIPRPSQTPLMKQFGIPAATVLSTPMNGVSDGPRVTKSGASDSDSDDGTAGLTPRGVTIYKKLKARGFPAERALAFARRAQNFGGSKG